MSCSIADQKSLHKVRTAILISGSGSNMQALIEDMQSDSDHPAAPCLVISNRPTAKGLERAAKLNVKTLTIDHKEYGTRREFEKAIQETLLQHNIELVCLAGFMRILTAFLTARWLGRMINIHPSLLPKYKGLHTHARAIENGDSQHGASVHWVSPELDSGPVIARTVIDILEDDTPESLAQRLLPKEHDLYKKALRMVAKQLMKKS